MSYNESIDYIFHYIEIMLKKIIISLNNGKELRGTLRASGRSHSIVVFVHGLLENQDSNLINESSKFFETKKIDSFSFNLYSEESSTRSLANTPLSQQSTDIVNVLTFFNKKYSSITLIAHSLGAYLSLLAIQKIKNKSDKITINNLVFWDPSIEPKDVFSNLVYREKTNTYELNKKNKIYIDKNVIDELSHLPTITELISEVSIPTLICGAERGGAKYAKKYYYSKNHIHNKYQLFKSDHNFSSKKALIQLYTHSNNWLQRKKGP